VSRRTAFVTGAAGFVGAAVVRALLDNGDGVIACVHRPADLARFSGVPGVSPVCVDILDPDALSAAMTGADDVYHFAALVDSHASRARLMTVNAAGTHNVWTCAAARRVRRALYCSSVAVYGLLGKGRQPITEDAPPRAIEPYGTSKLMGEWAVREVVARSGLPAVIIRPVAVFGPGENSAFGRDLRRAAFSKLIQGGGFEDRSFNFVHVDDVAGAALHLMACEGAPGQVFNVGVDRPVRFEEAFGSYVRALDRSGRSLSLPKILALASNSLSKAPFLSALASRWGRRIVFSVWRPGFDLLYSSVKLLATAYRFKWDSFEDVLVSCADQKASAQGRS
jgi:nucleoside-diphosphate-sugar epimerase